MPTDLSLVFLEQAGIRLVLNAVAMAILVGGIYRHGHRQPEFTFTYLVTNIVTLAAMLLMSTAEMGIGIGLGLLAIFGIFRYRTTEVDVVALSYLFASVGLAVVNGFLSTGMDIWSTGLLNVAILCTLAFAEFLRTRNGSSDHRLIYDRLELLARGRRVELIADLEERLGFRCEVLSVGDVDLLKETAQLRVRSVEDMA
jgi:hypothetical protein